MSLDHAQPVCYYDAMTALQFLLDSRARIDKPHKWTKHTLKSPMGAFCSVGALRETYIENHGSAPTALRERNEWLEGDILAAATYLCEANGVPNLTPAERFSYIANFNDFAYYPQVIAMWDRAIELAKADEEIETISVAELIEELAPV